MTGALSLPTMIVFQPREGQVTTCGSGEPHVTPLDNCPKCDKPIGGLSVNNGFSTPVDKGKLQQWVRICMIIGGISGSHYLSVYSM